MAEVQNIHRIQAILRKRQQEASGNPRVVVSYSTNYALYVHENLESHHPIGQAKYLEQPARELATTLGRQISENMRRGMTFAQSLLIAGLRLQRESQLLVPVDTGALKGSASTTLETNSN